MVGDGCHHWGEESGKKSTVIGDQRDKQEWKRWTALRLRHASPGNSSVSGQPVGLPEYRCDIYGQLEVHGLKVELRSGLPDVYK